MAREPEPELSPWMMNAVWWLLPLATIFVGGVMVWLFARESLTRLIGL